MLNTHYIRIEGDDLSRKLRLMAFPQELVGYNQICGQERCSRSPPLLPVCGESIGGVESIVDGGSCSNSACDNSPRAMLATALQQKLSVGIRGRRPTSSRVGRSVPLGTENVIDATTKA